MLWVDKHRPHSLDKFAHVNGDIAQHLKRLVADGDCPHLLFYGVSGAGKKTLALAVLREIFGASVEKVKVEGKTWKLEQGERKIEVELTTISSNYHVEMNPSDVGTKDRYVVQEVIKDMAKSRPIDAAGQQGFKVLLLNEVSVCVHKTRWPFTKGKSKNNKKKKTVLSPFKIHTQKKKEIQKHIQISR